MKRNTRESKIVDEIVAAELNGLTPESMQWLVGPMCAPNSANGKVMALPVTPSQQKTKNPVTALFPEKTA